MTSNNSEKNNSKQKPINDTTSSRSSSRSNSGITPDNKPKYRECFESYGEPKNK